MSNRESHKMINKGTHSLLAIYTLFIRTYCESHLDYDRGKEQDLTEATKVLNNSGRLSVK